MRKPSTDLHRPRGEGTFLLGAMAAILGIEFWLFTYNLRAPRAEKPTPNDRFAVRRAGDENGGWILEGFGRYCCYLRFATWQEAMAEAACRRRS